MYKYFLAIIIALYSTLLQADDNKVLTSHSINGVKYVYKLSLNKAERLPNWNWKSSPPPISFKIALEKAKTAFKSKFSDVSFLELNYIQLNRLAMEGTKNDIWAYFIEFSLMKHNRIDADGYNMAIVLFDGSVIFHE